MNKKVLLLNLALLALAGLLLWQLRLTPPASRVQERAVLLKNAQARVVLAPPAPAPVPPVAPAEYIDTVQKMLFSKDRNPNVIVDPPPAPSPRLLLRPCPLCRVITGRSVLEALRWSFSARQRPACKRATRGKISREATRWAILNFWLRPRFHHFRVERPGRGGKVERPEIEGRAGATGRRRASAPAAQQASAVIPSAELRRPPTSSAGRGNDMGAGLHACTNPDDGSPSGTVVDGYRKVSTRA